MATPLVLLLLAGLLALTVYMLMQATAVADKAKPTPPAADTSDS